MALDTIVTKLESVISDSLTSYHALSSDFDITRPPSEQSYARLTETLQLATPLIDQVMLDLKPGDENFISAITVSADSFSELVEQCAAPYSLSQALHLGSHVRLYPFYDAITDLKRIVDLLKNGPPRNKSNIFSKVVLVIALLCIFALGWETISRMRESAAFHIQLVATQNSSPLSLTIFGFDDLETEKGKKWRWSNAPISQIIFTMPERQAMVLTLRVNNSFPEQVMTVFINEREKAVLKHMPIHNWDDEGLAVRIPFDSNAGENRIRIVYDTWNTKDGKAYVPDPRKLGMKYFSVSLTLDSWLAHIGRKMFHTHP